jgi:hypothetical protein
MRALIMAALFTVASGAAALADDSVAGNWHANLGSRITIDMTVTPDGNWSSETQQKSQVVRQMKGTYKQEPAGPGTGTLVFTPTSSEVKTGTVETEVDKYQLASNGKQLKLTSKGDTMVFVKQEAK